MRAVLEWRGSAQNRSGRVMGPQVRGGAAARTISVGSTCRIIRLRLGRCGAKCLQPTASRINGCQARIGCKIAFEPPRIVHLRHETGFEQPRRVAEGERRFRPSGQPRFQPLKGHPYPMSVPDLYVFGLAPIEPARNLRTRLPLIGCRSATIDWARDRASARSIGSAGSKGGAG